MPTNDILETFVAALTESLHDGTFVRLQLARPVSTEDAPVKAIARLVELRGVLHVSVTLRFKTRDVTQNNPLSDAGAWLRSQLGPVFHSALLSTTKRDWQFSINKAGKARIVGHKPATTEAPSRAHDRQKHTILDATAEDWLRGLGVVDAAGKVRASMADKYSQINRYLEIFTHLTKGIRLQSIADMGCGKGYLTFGMWHLFRKQPVEVIGVEQRPELVVAANQLARQIGAEGLRFQQGTIESTTLPAVDALIALHACDTATDDAIRRGVEAGAKLIIVAPCCHKELRPQLGQPAPLADVLAHGIMAERMAEWATDGLRALILEWAGYRTKVLEFVASEHTPKNLMIAGIREEKPVRSVAARKQIEEFKRFFGINHHALDPLLDHGLGQG